MARSVLKVSTRETVTANWIMSYLPGLLDYAPLHHYQPAAETARALHDAGFSRVEQRVIHYTDLVDGSLQALKHQPELLLDDKHILNTAVLMRVPEQVRHEAIETIRRDYARGRLREIIAEFEPLVREYGDGFVFAAR
jgi:hypothetical protein